MTPVHLESGSTIVGGADPRVCRSLFALHPRPRRRRPPLAVAMLFENAVTLAESKFIYTSPMTRYRVSAVVALIAGLLLAWFVWSTEADPLSSYRFKLGLDLAGGTELVYKSRHESDAAGRAF